jgi:hypothetical protein
VDVSRYAYLIAGAIAFLALYFKARQLWQDPRNPALRAICGVLAGLGVAVTIGWEPLYIAFDEAVGVPNLARYLEHGSALVAAASLQTLFLYLGDPERAPRRVKLRWISLAVALTVMGFAFFAGDFDIEATRDFATRYATTPQLSHYMLGFLSYVALTMTDLLRMSARYGSQLPRSLLRFGTRLLLAGSLVGLTYVVHKTAFILTALAGESLPWHEGYASQIMLLVGIALVAGGLVVPAVGSYAVDAYHWRHRYRLYRDLAPLWEGIHSIVRDVALHPPRRRPGVRLMSVALYRRVIEIRDGLRQLAAYRDPAIADSATAEAVSRQLPDHEARAVGEAAGIAAMLDYLTATAPQDREPKTEGRISDEDAGDNIEADAEWLAAVARAYISSPIVAAIRRAGSHVAG